jgi:flagellar biosynthesis GTPase FlhF
MESATQDDVINNDVQSNGSENENNEEYNDDGEGEELDGFDDDDAEEEEDDDEFPESVFGAKEKKRLEKQREMRRQSMAMEKECLRESRVIFFRMKEQMSPEQLRRIRLIMGKLIAMSPPVADNHSKLAKAFVIWSEKLPLFLKCNELRRQLDERGIAMEVLRDSYYRDVLR